MYFQMEGNANSRSNIITRYYIQAKNKLHKAVREKILLSILKSDF